MQIVTLTEQVFAQSCKKLAAAVATQPNIVLSIAKGGVYLMENFKHNALIQPEVWGVLKPKNRSKKLSEFSAVKLLLKTLPYRFTNRIRVREFLKTKKIYSQPKQVWFETLKLTLGKAPIKEILIIDDALDTGNTAYWAKQLVQQKFPKAVVKIAVIAWTKEDAIIKPDYFLYKNKLVRFPWSADYKKI